MGTLADRWLAPFRAKDADALEAALADDFVHESPFGVVEGRAAYLALVRGNEEAFFGPPIEVVDVLDLGERCAVRYVVGEMPACDCIYGSGERIRRVVSYYHHGEKPTL